MLTFAESVADIREKDKSRLLILLITHLDAFQAPADKAHAKALGNEIKKMMLNHEYGLKQVTFIINQFIASHRRKLTPNMKAFLKGVKLSLDDKNLKAEMAQYPHDNSQRIQRKLESQIATNLFANPSQGMWDSVNAISENIIACIQEYRDVDCFDMFLDHLGPSADDPTLPSLPLAFGRFSSKPTLDDVIEVLTESTDFRRIMLIQFMFVRDVAKYLDLTEAQKDYIHNNNFSGDLKAFLADDKYTLDDVAMFFIYYTEFAKHIYSDRGRGILGQVTSKKLGISTNKEDRESMPEVDTTWLPDSICQFPDDNSAYFKSLTSRGIPYISGPSGMTSIFMGAMTLFGKFTDDMQKHYYILSVITFMVSGGLHSTHEVLTVPRVRLGLIPAYRATGENMGNYQDFFQLFSADRTVTSCLDRAFHDTTTWLQTLYPQECQLKIPDVCTKDMDCAPIFGCLVQ